MRPPIDRHPDGVMIGPMARIGQLGGDDGDLMVRTSRARLIGTWKGTGELLINGASVGNVRYSIEAREDGQGRQSGGGILTGEDEVITRAFGQSEAELMIETGATIRIAVTEVRGTMRKDKASVPPWQYLRSWR